MKDEFGLQFGLRRLVKALTELHIPHEHVEHEGGHFGLDRRYAEGPPSHRPRPAQHLAMHGV